MRTYLFQFRGIELRMRLQLPRGRRVLDENEACVGSAEEMGDSVPVTSVPVEYCTASE